MQVSSSAAKPSALIFTNNPHLYFDSTEFELEAAGWEVHLAPVTEYYPEYPAHYVSELFFNVSGYTLVLVEDGYIDPVIGSLFEACLGKLAISGYIKYKGHNWYLMLENTPSIDMNTLLAVIENNPNDTKIEQ